MKKWSLSGGPPWYATQPTLTKLADGTADGFHIGLAVIGQMSACFSELLGRASQTHDRRKEPPHFPLHAGFASGSAAVGLRH